MNAIIAHEAKEKDTGYYHLVNDRGTASLCGSLNDESPFASAIAERISQTVADQRSFRLCRRCSYLADVQMAATPATDE